VPESHLCCKDDNEFLDGSDWREPARLERMAAAVAQLAERWDISDIVTFDEDGVTGHQNHSACFHIVSHFLSALRGGGSGRGAPVRAFALESIHGIRHYLGILDVFISAFLAVRTRGALLDHHHKRQQAEHDSRAAHAEGSSAGENESGTGADGGETYRRYAEISYVHVNSLPLLPFELMDEGIAPAWSWRARNRLLNISLSLTLVSCLFSAVFRCVQRTIRSSSGSVS
jgi:hypothetical protein